VLFETRKEKKKRIMERNKRHHIVNLMAWQHEGVGARGDLSAPEFDPGPSREYEQRKKKEEDVVWSAKVGSVRNRLTNKRRASQDRWNRFAGTSGGGGRGR
jgi:hypothetical protein